MNFIPFCVNLYWFYTNKNAKTKQQTNNVGIKGLIKMKTKKDVLLASIIYHLFK